MRFKNQRCETISLLHIIISIISIVTCCYNGSIIIFNFACFAVSSLRSTGLFTLTTSQNNDLELRSSWKTSSRSLAQRQSHVISTIITPWPASHLQKEDLTVRLDRLSMSGLCSLLKVKFVCMATVCLQPWIRIQLDSDTLHAQYFLHNPNSFKILPENTLDLKITPFGKWYATRERYIFSKWLCDENVTANLWDQFVIQISRKSWRHITCKA